MKKDYKNHPFKVGDTVYHPLRGKGVITCSLPIKIDVIFYNEECTAIKDGIKLLSFTPYEIPANWERPHEPKDGDIVASSLFVGIYGGKSENGAIKLLAFLSFNRGFMKVNEFPEIGCGYVKEFRPATSEEQQKLFDALEKEGWRWNDEKKKLEKIPEPLKESDMVIVWNCWNQTTRG